MMNPLLREIASRENLPTPAYFYDLSLLGKTVEAIKIPLPIPVSRFIML